MMLLTTIAAAATSGWGGVLVMLGLAALVAGMVASVRGHLVLLRLASCQTILLARRCPLSHQKQWVAMQCLVLRKTMMALLWNLALRQT